MSIAPKGPTGFQGADVIITMLSQGKVVREVVLRENGIATGLRPGQSPCPPGGDHGPASDLVIGTIIVDTSSSSPFDTRRLGADLEAIGLVLVDAPVTQAHLHDTNTGDTTLMVGANSQDAVDKVMPVLQAMAKYVFYMGPSGAGHAMKTEQTISVLRPSSPCPTLWLQVKSLTSIRSR